MDDNKVSHMDKTFNSMIAYTIEEDVGDLSHTTGKKHTFLGMDINFIVGKKVSFFTQHHIGEALEVFF